MTHQVKETMIENMETTLVYIFCGLLAYLLGAVPFGLLVAKARGVDIRKAGSGNIGATNVFRSVGKKYGILVFACDALKGYVSAVLIPLAAGMATGTDYGLNLALLCGFLAIAGHNWPVYLKFRGGKGIATSAGVLIGLAPSAVGIGFITWIAAFLLSRYVSVASILAALMVAGSSWAIYYRQTILLPCVLTILALLAVVRHKSNISRLIKGNENRFQFGKKQ